MGGNSQSHSTTPAAQPLGRTNQADGVYEKDGKKFRVKGGEVYAY